MENFENTNKNLIKSYDQEYINGDDPYKNQTSISNKTVVGFFAPKPKHTYYAIITLIVTTIIYIIGIHSGIDAFYIYQNHRFLFYFLILLTVVGYIITIVLSISSVKYRKKIKDRYEISNQFLIFISALISELVLSFFILSTIKIPLISFALIGVCLIYINSLHIPFYLQNKPQEKENQKVNFSRLISLLLFSLSLIILSILILLILFINLN